MTCPHCGTQDPRYLARPDHGGYVCCANCGTTFRRGDSLTCLDKGADCKGFVEYRQALSATGVAYPRCDSHWSRRLESQAAIEERYPYHQPADFDPSYAGERWDEDY